MVLIMTRNDDCNDDCDNDDDCEDYDCDDYDCDDDDCNGDYDCDDGYDALYKMVAIEIITRMSK